MRSDRYKKTVDFNGEEYSPELIRRYEDPTYAKAAEEYEKEAMRRKQQRKEAQREIQDTYDESLSQRSRSQKSKGKKKHRFRLKTFLKNILSLILILFVAGSGFFFYLTGNFDKVDTKKDDFAIDSQVAKELRGYRNIAILGVDARAGEGYDGSRTDAIIIMSIHKLTGDVRLISVMRDSYVRMEYFDGKSILDKVTHAHHYGGGVNTVAALNRSLDLNIEEFVIFNWKAVSDVVDCLGGIEINVKSNEISDLNKYGPETADNVGGTYHKITKKGKQTLENLQCH